MSPFNLTLTLITTFDLGILKMFDMLLSAWAMQEAVDVGWGFNPTGEVVASKESAWVTSNPPYQANATEDMSKQKVKIIQITSILEKNLC